MQLPYEEAADSFTAMAIIHCPEAAWVEEGGPCTGAFEGRGGARWVGQNPLDPATPAMLSPGMRVVHL
jgi:hypothetical protein